MTCPSTPLSPLKVASLYGQGNAEKLSSMGLIIKNETEDSTTILKAAALRGYPRMSVEQLKFLFAHLEVPWVGPKPTTLSMLVHALILHVFPLMKEEEVIKILEARQAPSKQMFHTTLAENLALAEDVVLESDRKELRETVRQLEKDIALRQLVGDTKATAPLYMIDCFVFFAPLHPSANP